MKNSSNNNVLTKIIKHIDNKLGQDTIILDLGGISSLCDYFIITSASSSPQAKAIADELQKELEKEQIYLSHKEGYDAARWILLDFGDFIIHVFHKEDREFYNLEEIWRDASPLNIDKLSSDNV